MSELRKDYILERWVIINEHRKKRPQQFHKVSQPMAVDKCFFCPGNEETTPKEIGRIESEGIWKIRWFPNLYAAVNTDGSPKIKNAKFFTHGHGYGEHEVVVETPDHGKQLADLSEKDIANVLKVYADRISALSRKKNVQYVLVFKNHGSDGGTSIIHSHSQIVTLPMVPPQIKEEVKASKKFKKCPYCEILKKEASSGRRIQETKSFVAFAPYASRFNYEAWIFPKKHLKNITGLNDTQLLELAKILKRLLVKIQSLGLSYNYFLHYSPQKENLHFHIELTPRKAVWAGFENGSSIIINSVSPESAAKFFRSK
jgi:UDPglucose--hexose-1-phosphate uridylyltransferase